ncbi:MAG: hypothetical protein DHS20C16_16910 [Phycisphaerae bacterium]|nr:MAG: hypothetical protein DHS20C16_16910 [Phycisphaerae bacterium]
MTVTCKCFIAPPNCGDAPPNADAEQSTKMESATIFVIAVIGSPLIANDAFQG